MENPSVPPLPDEEIQTGVLMEGNPMQDLMLAVSEINQLNQCAHSIAFIELTRYRKGKNEYPETGTGWLIAPGLVLTCWHVIAAIASADELPPTRSELREQIKHMLVSFNHVEIGKGGVQYHVSKLEYPLSGSNVQDFALLRLKDRIDRPVERFTPLPIELDPPFAKQTRLLIIQHPLGQTQHFTGGNYVRRSGTTGRIFYTTATETGTSGAPVLNRYNWRSVALHNGENKDAHLREGTLIKYILSELQEKKPNLYNEIVNAQYNLDNSLPPVHLTHPLNPYEQSSEVTFQASTPAMNPAKQEAAPFSSNEKRTPAQEYEYNYFSTFKHSSAVLCVTFHPDGRYLASGEHAGIINVWDTSTKGLGHTLKTLTGATPSLAFSPDGRYLASGGEDGTLILWDFHTRTRAKTLQGHTHWVSWLAFSSDGQSLISGSDDGSVKIREILYGMMIHEFKGQAGIFSVASHPQQPWIASCASGEDIKLQSFPRSSKTPLLEPLTGVRCLAFSPDGRYLAAAEEQGFITIYETINWKIIQKFTRYSGRIRCLAFHPDSYLLASGGEDRVIQLWHVPSGKNVQTLVKHTDKITSVAFSPNGQFIASGGNDAGIILWEHV